MRERIAILDGVRTPFCKAGGALRGVSAVDLGVACARELLARAPFPADAIDEVIVGNVCQPADSQNIARVIALHAGVPVATPAVTVHRNCASGMESVSAAAMRIHAGEGNVFLAMGTESMSNVPLLFDPRMAHWLHGLRKARSPLARLRALARFRPRLLRPVIGLEVGLTDPVCGLSMGQTAEVLADAFEIDRAAQDAYALESHRRAVAAMRSGRLAEEIVPVSLPPDCGRFQAEDEGPREKQTIEALARLKPYFRRGTGSVTVGNACQVTDGAAGLLVASESWARAHGVKPLAFVTGFAYAGLEGDRMGLGPAYATARLLQRTGLALEDFGVVELNEAFAAQVLANVKAFASATFAREALGRETALGELQPDRLNVNGGAIALGHPVGASGGRLLLTLVHELRRRDIRRGLATLCIGGGQGAAFALEVAS